MANKAAMKGGGAPPLASALEGPRRTPPNGGDPRNTPEELDGRQKHPLASLDSLFEIARGGSPRPIQDYLTDSPDGVNWISISDAPEGAKYITGTKRRIIQEGTKKSRMVYPGDFLLTNSMSFGRPYILQTTGCIHDGWLVLSPRDKSVHPDFFFYLLSSNSVYSEFERLAAGATVKNLNIDLVKGIKVHLPPLPDQRRIAEVLDRVEGLRAKRRNAISLLDIYSQAMFLEMFGDPTLNPMAWPEKLLGELTIRITKGESPKWQGHEYQDDGALFVTSENVRLGKIDLSEPKFVPLEFHAKLRRSELKKGDLLVNLVGASIGRSCIFPGFDRPANINQAVGVATIDESKIEIDYVASLFISDHGQMLLLNNRVEGARANISLTDLRELPIPIPPAKLQQEFGRRKAIFEKLKAFHRTSLAQLDALFASLQHRAFRGEL